MQLHLPTRTHTPTCGSEFVGSDRVDGQLALLDMIFGFADLVTLSPLPFTRPELAADGPLSIRGGRHPIVGAVQEDCKFVPNDTYMRCGRAGQGRAEAPAARRNRSRMC